MVCLFGRGERERILYLAVVESVRIAKHGLHSIALGITIETMMIQH